MSPSFILQRSWPQPKIDLLLRAGLLPEANAREAWRTWLLGSDLTTMSWGEVRLVVALSARLKQLDPTSPQRPRIDAIARIHWARTHAKLLSLVEVADLFAARSIPFLVFKGAAAHVEAIEQLRRRIPGDADILVREPDVARALEALLATGWESALGESAEYLRAAYIVRGGGNLRKDAYGEIDLHRHTVHFCRDDPAVDEDLWSDARRFQMSDRSFLVPSPADSLLIGLAHAADSEGGDWALDAAARISGPGMDWNRFVENTFRRGLVPQIRAGLLYLTSVLGQEIPDRVVDTLARNPGGLAIQAAHWANAHRDVSQPIPVRAVARIAARVLAAQGYRLWASDRSVVPVRRARSVWRLVPRHSIYQSAADKEWGQHFEVAIPKPIHPNAMRRLFVSVMVRPKAMSRRLFLDLSANGIGFARLRTRIGGGGGTSRERQLSFAVPLPDHVARARRITIAARPTAYQSPLLTAEEREETAAIPFRVREIAIIG